MRVPDVRKIAILRANGIGDLVFALPAVEALRLAYPEAELIWLGRPLHQEFFSCRPGPVDRVIIVPPSRGVRDEPEGEDEARVQDFFDMMAAEKFDVAVQMHGGGRFSNPFLKKLGARVTVGLRTSDAIALDRWVPYTYFQHEVLRYVEVAALLDAAPVQLEPQVCVTQQDLSEASLPLPPSDEPLVAIHPGASDSRRRWPPERFAAVGDALARTGSMVVVIGTAPERHAVDVVCEAMMMPAMNLAQRLSLGGLIGLLSRCALVLGNDSGPLHLARTVGASTVGIYWCGNFINAGPLSRTRHRAAISWRLACPVCGVHCLEGRCHHTESFMREVSVEEVTAQALDLIEHGATQQGGPERVSLSPDYS